MLSTSTDHHARTDATRVASGYRAVRKRRAMMSPSEKDLLIHNAQRASNFLRTLASENRLLILCDLVDSEKSVTELNNLLGLSQPTLSQHLARLRADGFVSTRRQGKSIYYSLSNESVRVVIGVLYELFCSPQAKGKKPMPRNDETVGDAVSVIAARRASSAPAARSGEARKPRPERAIRSGQKRETSATAKSRTRA